MAIVVDTAKTGRPATIPLLEETREILREISWPDDPAEPLLRNTFGDPWTADGLTASFIKARDAAGVAGKRLHDARGTFATRLRHAGLTCDEIAGVMGWEPKRVERILARYVDQAAIVRSIAERLKRT